MTSPALAGEGMNHTAVRNHRIPKRSKLDTHDILALRAEEEIMAMAKTPIEIDQDALAVAAEVLGTTSKKDTVNAALREVGQRLVRLRALARLGEMADRGDFDEFLEDKAAYRR
jgi:Arc/MetJ family transcription regulator